jgi:mRNA-degrading endonuclease toxin of MazEF toxin-antitoxin module
VIVSGDVVPRRDTDAELYVAILSNEAHIRATTGRLITCPFIPGAPPAGAMALVVAVAQPTGVLLPELVQWLPSAALDDVIGNVGPAALQEAASIVGSLIDHS